MKKHVRKSIRIPEDEASALTALAADYGVPESSLIEEWVRHTLRESRILHAAGAYERDEVDLREGASLAGVPIGVFVDELAERRIPLLRDSEMIEREIADLQATFGTGRQHPITTAESPTVHAVASTRRSGRRPRRKA